MIGGFVKYAGIMQNGSDFHCLLSFVAAECETVTCLVSDQGLQSYSLHCPSSSNFCKHQQVVKWMSVYF